MTQLTCTCSQLGKIGRLGNQLFQVAGTLAFAAMEGCEVSLDPAWPYRDYFTIADRHFLPPAHHEIDMIGYMQDESPITRAWPQICDQFRLKRSGELQPAYDTLAIHFRRTDYRKYPDRFYLLGPEYYLHAIAQLEAAGCTWNQIVVFSDDLGAATEQLSELKGPRYFWGPDATDPQDDIKTLARMSLCGLHIIANSTFSWWAAYLATRNNSTRKVVMPSRWGVGADTFQGRAESLRVDGWIQV